MGFMCKYFQWSNSTSKTNLYFKTVVLFDALVWNINEETFLKPNWLFKVVDVDLQIK